MASSLPLKVLLVGFGRMGRRHAVVYDKSDNFDLVAICGREYQRHDANTAHKQAGFFTDYDQALAGTRPDLVCISTHIDTHDEYSRKAIEQGSHVFLEKPATTSVATTRQLIEYANARHLKLIIGYVLHHDLLWATFIEECRKLERPLQIVIQLDQHSAGEEWAIHQKILHDSSIASDCAIHFFDIMTQAIQREPASVDAITMNTHNDASLNDNSLSTTVTYTDGSTGTYVSAWGPGFQAEPLSAIHANGQDGSVSIAEGEGRSDVVVRRKDQSDEIVYSDLLHLEHATEQQQDFVFGCISHDLDLSEHHRRTLLSMQLAEETDRASGRQSLVARNAL